MADLTPDLKTPARIYNPDTMRTTWLPEAWFAFECEVDATHPSAVTRSQILTKTKWGVYKKYGSAPVKTGEFTGYAAPTRKALLELLGGGKMTNRFPYKTVMFEGREVVLRKETIAGWEESV